MSLAPRILAAAGLLAVPALLAVGSQALSRPAEVPLQERQTVVVDLAPAGTTDAAPTEGGTGPAEQDTGTTPPSPTPEPSPEPSPEVPRPAPAPVTPAPITPAPATPAPAVPAPVPPADQGTPGLVERQMLGDADDDDGPDTDDDGDDED